MNGGWRVGRIGSIEIRLDASLAILAALVAFNMWEVFSFERTTFDAGAIALAVGGAVLLIASILVHELAHAAFARLRGIPVSHIRLFVFGGTAHTEESKTPFDEFLVTVVGPVSSAALGGVFFLLHRLDRSPFISIFDLFLLLGIWNLALAVFNLLPGAPLDGGRVFHSAVWKLTRDRDKATTVAARTGQGLGLLLVAAGVWLLFTSNDIRDLWFIFIGWEVNRGASAELEASRRRRVALSSIRGIMNAPPPVIPADLSIRQARESFLDGHEGEVFPVMQDGRVLGFVSSSEVRDASPESKVREVAFHEPGAVEASPEETIAEVADRLGDREWQVILVVERGRLVGVIERQAPSAIQRRWGK